MINKCTTRDRRPYRLIKSIVGLLTLLILSACASVSTVTQHDPWEPMNRSIYAFNEAIDSAVLRPVATTYIAVTPVPVVQGISNFFSNLGDLWSFFNNALQFKPLEAASSLGRFGVNTVIGLVGIFDVATSIGIERHTEDFGQTLGYWGLSSGPYVVIPLLGPSSVRDAAGTIVEMQYSVLSNMEDKTTKNSLQLLNGVNRRSELLQASALVDQVALDKYTFVRDGYLGHRRNLVLDGSLSEEIWGLGLKKIDGVSSDESIKEIK